VEQEQTVDVESTSQGTWISNNTVFRTSEPVTDWWKYYTDYLKDDRIDHVTHDGFVIMKKDFYNRELKGVEEMSYDSGFLNGIGATLGTEAGLFLLVTAVFALIDSRVAKFIKNQKKGKDAK
jgi:hypothetical protein